MTDGTVQPYLPVDAYDNVHDFVAVEGRRPTEAWVRLQVRVTDATVEVTAHQLHNADPVCGVFLWAHTYLRPAGKTRDECVAAGIRALLLRQEAGSLLP